MLQINSYRCADLVSICRRNLGKTYTVLSYLQNEKLYIISNQNLIVFMNDETDEKYLRLNMYFLNGWIQV